MKKQAHLCALVCTLVCGLSSVSFAQWTLDIEAGLNQSRMDISDLEAIYPDIDIRSSSVGGLYLGLTPKYALTDKWTVGMGVQYSQEGSKEHHESGFFEDFNNAYRFSYARLLPTVGYEVFDQIKLSTGVNFGFLLGEGEAKNGLFNEDWEALLIYIIEKRDVGAHIGARYDVSNFFVQVRYNVGLVDLETDLMYTDDNGNIIDADVKRYNRNLQIGVGYTFGG